MCFGSRERGFAMECWVEVARVGELAEGSGRTVTAGEQRLALFNDGGEFLALDDTCPHQGGSLGGGVLHDGRVICPLHAWVFDARTGRCPRETHEPVATYPVRRTGDVLEVRLDRAAGSS